MGLYNDRILPRIIDIVCSTQTMTEQRARTVPKAHGRVLELGMGTGLNLPHYDSSRVVSVTGIDPCERSLDLAAKRARETAFSVDLVRASAEALPFEDNAFDSVVSTYSLCTIPNPDAALREVRRVLRPGGTFLFCEHVASPHQSVRLWQNRLNRVWGCCFGGCNINRDVRRMVCDAGLGLDEAVSEDVSGEIVLIRHQSRGLALKTA